MEILAKTAVTEITLENISEDTAIKIGSIRFQPGQTITILPENAEKAFLKAQEQKIPEAHGNVIQNAKAPSPDNDQQALIANLSEQNSYLQSVIDRQFALLKQQQEFMKAEIPGAARMPFFQDPDKGSKKRVVAQADPTQPTSSSKRPSKK